MKNIQIKIIIAVSLIILISACHTLEHNGFEIESTNNIMPKKENTPDKKIDKTRKFLKKTLVKPPIVKARETENDRFNPKSILNLSEKQLFKKMGKSNFVKYEGKLKNHQYYLKNCFIDIFVIKKNNEYFVKFFQKRSIKLNGFLNEENCLNELSRKLTVLEQ
jgi:hypothetical protein